MTCENSEGASLGSYDLDDGNMEGQGYFPEKLRWADSSSDPEGLQRSTSSDASTLAELSSEDEESPSSVSSHAQASKIQTRPPSEDDWFGCARIPPWVSRNQMPRIESPLAMKNTFVYVSDEYEEEMTKDIRRVKSCPALFHSMSRHDRVSKRVSLRSSAYYHREAQDKTSDTKPRIGVTTASMPKSLSWPNNGGEPRGMMTGDTESVKDSSRGTAEEVCGTASKHDGRREQFKAAIRFARGSSKRSQITQKKKQPKKCKQQKQQQGAPQSMSFSVWRASNIGPFMLVSFVFLLIMWCRKTGSEQSVEKKFEPSNQACYVGRIPSYIISTIEPRIVVPDSTDHLPTVILHAPCLLKSFVATAQRYTHSAAAWNYAESRSANQIEVRHYYEKPRVEKKHIHRRKKVEEFLLRNIIPKVGILDDATAPLYGSLAGRKQGLIIGLFEPDALHKYRPMLSAIATAVQSNYQVTYMDTQKDKVWIESEFGAVSFPTIVINQEFPGKAVLYNGDMSASALFMFLRDLAAGCMSHKAPEKTRLLMGGSQAQDEICDAAPLMRA